MTQTDPYDPALNPDPELDPVIDPDTGEPVVPESGEDDQPE
jgi:hypothetical protein